MNSMISNWTKFITNRGKNKQYIKNQFKKSEKFTVFFLVKIFQIDGRIFYSTSQELFSNK